MTKSELGKLGEDAAAKYLESKGYEIVCRNYRYSHLETDIICQGFGYTVFAEVKTRNPASADFLSPGGAVWGKKSMNLILCAEAYIREAKRRGDEIGQPRIDVIEIYMGKDNDITRINHIENAVIDSRRR